MNEVRTWDELTEIEQDEYIIWVVHLVDEGILSIDRDSEIYQKAKRMYENDVDKTRMDEPLSDIFDGLDVDFPNDM